ncbi:class I SAM-dependent methyltransferase [Verminephrobacter aporrectodeae]|uniref:class I SAM-dependent methyltransferase n=1 Tax=Verminephrobacter aporrectodeae TaxID=1110389 RepID=UPI0022379695|nr:class I SAM-dependent methyltransferase [Verminephrobacter aporrectodeae]MCW5222494.1 class I SAM-dependent methyltransferase [Verminephrobacter aporrectodeae subsp. tuberculatae]MCW5287959.1 class I SAM-dependent methyltransferase [Verminephrobacter aporrectodeae subsp. tuberculatae]MCW8176984.1 class I SAM-dependent methyltransferase [Verminephrobacter aporrectodeae subsp. tuberculatae]MCW8197965.1 class I SAM-dependent methyltransferase [Verminephrobacter aporrectodeae subsp. tuberculatae
MSDIGRYDYAFDPDGEAWAARLLRRVPPGGTVLELGPGPGAMTRVLLARGHRVTVVENDPQALAVLATLGVELNAGDLEDAHCWDAFAGRRFDTVLACDVLEHLRQPEDVLRRLGEFVAPMGRLLISVPNIAYAGVVAALRNGVFDYSDKGLLDRTHVHFFTRRSLEKTLLGCDWTPRIWEAHREPMENSEFAGYWSALSDAQRQSLLANWPDFDVYQWMVLATPAVDPMAWDVSEARARADRLHGELQALMQVHQHEHASLLEHQKAMAQARETLGDFQSEVQALHRAAERLRAEKAAAEAESQALRLAAEHAWPARWRRRLVRWRLLRG